MNVGVIRCPSVDECLSSCFALQMYEQYLKYQTFTEKNSIILTFSRDA